jgi:hypothetical protein
MFGPIFLGVLIGSGVAIVMAGINLVLQLSEQESRFNWKEPLVLSLAISATAAVVIAMGDIINGGDQYAVSGAAAIFIPMLPLITAGSLLGRGTGWALQWLRHRH